MEIRGFERIEQRSDAFGDLLSFHDGGLDVFAVIWHNTVNNLNRQHVVKLFDHERVLRSPGAASAGAAAGTRPDSACV